MARKGKRGRNRAKSGEILDLPFSYSAQFIPSSMDGSFLSIGHKTIYYLEGNIRKILEHKTIGLKTLTLKEISGTS